MTDEFPTYAQIYEAINTLGDDYGAFFVRTARDRQRILEMGCGAGRILFHLATQTKAEIHGLDIDATMVAQCRRMVEARNLNHRVFIHRDDFLARSLSAPFDLIYFSNDTIALEPDIRQRAALFIRCAALLSPGGRLVIPVTHPKYFMHADTRALDSEGLTPEGRVVQVEYRRTNLLLGRLQGLKFIDFYPNSAAKPVSRSFTRDLGIVTPTELRLLGAKAGLKIEAEFGGFDRRPPSAESPRFIVTFIRPRCS